jgi:FtsP/CotA-like multicopper oxidase with cupredoxin domain
MKVRITQKSDAKQPLPATLSVIQRYDLQNAVNQANPRVFTLRLQQQAPYWLLNGRVFDMETVANNEIVKLNTLEVWEFDNQPGTEGMMETAHPMHLHGLQFQVIERSIRPDMAALREQVSAGFTDEGWKDTVLVMPGEKLRFLAKFENYAGLFLYHCHNLEHEDQGMMRNYRITA